MKILISALLCTIMFFQSHEIYSQITENKLIGSWVEKGKVNGAKIDFIKKGKVYFVKAPQKPTETFNYKIENDILYLWPNISEKYKTGHPISYDSSKNELTIWSLYISTPENPSKTIFVKK